MNVSISGHHISITDAMDKAVREKLEKVERHFDQIQSIKCCDSTAYQCSTAVINMFFHKYKK